jgi:hypothetical protein
VRAPGAFDVTEEVGRRRFHDAEVGTGDRGAAEDLDTDGPVEHDEYRGVVAQFHLGDRVEQVVEGAVPIGCEEHHDVDGFCAARAALRRRSSCCRPHVRPPRS